MIVWSISSGTNRSYHRYRGVARYDSRPCGPGESSYNIHPSLCPYFDSRTTHSGYTIICTHHVFRIIQQLCGGLYAFKTVHDLVDHLVCETIVLGQGDNIDQMSDRLNARPWHEQVSPHAYDPPNALFEMTPVERPSFTLITERLSVGLVHA
jgi:hypothetical protein